MPEHTYTVVDEEEGIIVCNDCGASTTMGHELMIEHLPTCVSGEAKKWEEYYADQEDDDEGATGNTYDRLNHH